MKKFCFHPFKKAHISTSGDVYICCQPWLGISLGNIFQKNFDDIWNSKNAIKIRESIIDGTFRYCRGDLCPRIISGMVEKEGQSDEAGSLGESNRTRLDTGPEHISLNYDYTCTLHCRSCRTRVKIMGRKESNKLIQFQRSMMNSPLFQNVKRITVTGAGEALASRVYMDLFTRLDTKQHPRLRITLRTNGLLLTPKKWDQIKNSHSAIDNITISIDAATKETYETLRRGGDFLKLMDNLQFISTVKKKHSIRIQLNFVVQKQNFREMPEFVKMAKKFSFDNVVFTQLMDWNTFDANEYSSLAVHKPDHPDFENLKEILKIPILKDPIVSLKNLSHLRENQ